MGKLDTKIKYVLAAAVLFALAAIAALYGGAFNVSAATSFSNVFDDLRTDSTFNVEKYPTKKGDGSLNVIQLAESTDSELFVYVYHPSADKQTTASTISIAEQLNNADDLQPVLYNLQLVSNVGVFYKYTVTGFKVSSEKERFYNVIMLQRPYVAAYDGASSNDSAINRRAYGVGQYWYATTTDNGDVTYKMLEVETVQIINPFTSHIRKKKAGTGSNRTDYYQDNYYVAFSTDRNIEKLLSATVEYRIQDYYYKNNSVLNFGSTEFSKKAVFTNERNTTRDVYADETVNLKQEGFTLLFGAVDLSKKFTWNRIQSSEDFVNTAGASSSDNNEVKKLQWVLMFEETSAFCYQDGSLITVYEESGQIIDNVTVLRLEFVEDGVTYNLGTVSDTVSGKPPFGGGNTDPDDPDDSGEQSFLEYVWHCITALFTGTASAKETTVAIIALLVCLVLLCVLGYIISAIVSIFVPALRPVLRAILKTVGKALLWVILLPFRAIAALCRAISNVTARRKATAAARSKKK